MTETSPPTLHAPSRTILRHEMRLALLALVALTWMTGCATSGAKSRISEFQDASAPSVLDQDGGGFGFWNERDDFQLLQQSSGLEEDSWHEVGEPLETDDAQALWEALARTGTTLQNFGPRRSLLFALRSVLIEDEDVSYAELLQRLRPFRVLVVMRPDGYLVSALTGRSLQRMGKGRVELRDGRLMVGQFEVGAFYRDKGGVFYTVDDSLRQPGTMVGELGLERDWLNAALDGSEDSLLLSAEGALAVEQVALPVGVTATALGAGAGAVYVLTEAPKDSDGDGSAQSSGTSKGTGGGFKPFTEGNFRENLARLTGELPAQSHAHHVFPQKFATDFKAMGINIHDPKYGAWWAQSSHLKKATEYAKKWDAFIVREPTREQILQFGRDLGVEYGFKVNF